MSNVLPVALMSYKKKVVIHSCFTAEFSLPQIDKLEGKLLNEVMYSRDCAEYVYVLTSSLGKC